MAAVRSGSERVTRHAGLSETMLTPDPRIAVIHHLQQPFLGHAAEPLGAVEELFGGALPDLDAVDAIVSFGGEASAWEPQFEPELELIREAVKREIPFLGVCLGAQLLALAHGGTVSRLPRRLVTWAPLTTHRRGPDPRRPPARRARPALEPGRDRTAA